MADATIVVGVTTKSVSEFLAEKGLTAPPLTERTPTLGYGANGAPSSLKGKYSLEKFPRPAVFPVLKGELGDFEIVYAAHFVSNGTMPATIHHSPGANSDVYVNYLDDEELARMHDSEGIGFLYESVNINDIDLRLEDGSAIDSISVYVDLYGAYLVDGKPMAISKVPAMPRVLPDGDHFAVLSDVKLRVNHPGTVFSFALENVQSADLRSERTEAIRSNCTPFDYDETEIVEGATADATPCEN